MLRDAELWYRDLSETASLEEIRGCRVAIDAEHFLQTSALFKTGHCEPLVAALGGLPFTFEEVLASELKNFDKLKLEVEFIFPGVDVSLSDSRERRRLQGVAINEEAWDLYDSNLADQSVEKFGLSTYVQPSDYFRAFQKLLKNQAIAYSVAPYSASAQLAYFERTKLGDDKYVHCIAGSSELLFYQCGKFITGWDWENGQFEFIQRSKCIEDLGRFANNHVDVTEEMFVDALLLAGSHVLPTLPMLEAFAVKLPKPRQAVDFITAKGGSAYLAVRDVSKQLEKSNRPTYFDDFCKAKFAIKHMPILTREGKIVAVNEGELPNNPNDFLGCQLPAELVYYMSKGLINTRIVGWEASREIVEPPPIDGGQSPEYRKLISTKLAPLRNASIALLASNLHRWFQKEKMRLRCWFAGPDASPFTLEGVNDIQALAEGWQIQNEDLPSEANQRFGSIGAAILALQDDDFVAMSTREADAKPYFTTVNSVMYNMFWRFLAVREYVDKNHQLTRWGRVLVAIVTACRGDKELEEAAVLAVELLRLGLLNADEGMFPEYKGAPIRGTDIERQYNLLISRVAGLGTLHHKIGFTGPLSQHMLGFNSMINAVRSASRDLMEVCVTHMFISGTVDREHVFDDFQKITMDIPFLLPQNCALSIAVKSYLDEMAAMDARIPTPDKKSAVMARLETSWLPHATNLRSDLDQAFELFNAVLEGVNASGDLIKESEQIFWREAGAWLAEMR